jgi:hypothetical protein
MVASHPLRDMEIRVVGRSKIVSSDIGSKRIGSVSVIVDLLGKITYYHEIY